MKRVIICMFVALLATVTVQAQQIAVVSSDGTKMYQTLAEAIEGANSGSTIYLPGGGFQIADDVTIKKQLTIIGIGHKPNSDNSDGNTTISGNICFDEGSSGSSVMGCYISGGVRIGYTGSGNKINNVNNIIIKHCNLNFVAVANSTCTGTIVNQNYIRSNSNFGDSGGAITNNVLYSLNGVSGGEIINNIFINSTSVGGSNYSLGAKNSTISNNVFLATFWGLQSDNVFSGNMCNSYSSSSSPYSVFIEHDMTGKEWSDIFEKYDAAKISAKSFESISFHFNETYDQYEKYVGIYAGMGFTDSGMAPVPFIEAKDIPDKTDAEGKLNIKIRVKASE